MATLVDVAKEAGLAVSTVSRVLNNRGYISDNARKKVYNAMQKLNYRPNEVARSLHRKTTNTIGLIVPHIKHPYFAEVISNMEDQAYKKGYKILLCNSQSMEEKEEEYIEICTGNRVAGIIMCTGGVSMKKFYDLNIPVITLERFMDFGTASIECDNEQGGRMAAELLIEKGCKNLLYIGNIASVPMPADMRDIGFQKICEEKGISYHEIDTDKERYKSMSYREDIEEALKRYPETDGIFANSDVIAAQALQVCKKLDISVPDQMKIVGFDDVELASLTSPQLTTVHQPVKEMAEIAVNLFHEAVSGNIVPRRTMLPVSLIERESTG